MRLPTLRRRDTRNVVEPPSQQYPHDVLARVLTEHIGPLVIADGVLHRSRRCSVAAHSPFSRRPRPAGPSDLARLLGRMCPLCVTDPGSRDLLFEARRAVAEFDQARATVVKILAGGELPSVFSAPLADAWRRALLVGVSRGGEPALGDAHPQLWAPVLPVQRTARDLYAAAWNTRVAPGPRHLALFPHVFRALYPPMSYPSAQQEFVASMVLAGRPVAAPRGGNWLVADCVAPAGQTRARDQWGRALEAGGIVDLGPADQPLPEMVWDAFEAIYSPNLPTPAPLALATAITVTS